MKENEKGKNFRNKQEKEEVICYLNGRAMTKSKLEKTFPKKKKINQKENI